MRVVAALALLLAAGAAQAASPEEVKKKIETKYPVQVLKVDTVEIDGRKAYSVRVMRKDGGSGAFGVSTLAADAESGELLSAFRHRASGYTMPESVEGDPRQVTVPRQGSTWR
jgi:hypothetical protein